MTLRRFLSVFLLVSTIVHAAPPNWVKQALQEDVSPWAADQPAVQLLDSSDVRYTSADRVVRRVRLVTRVLSQAGFPHARAHWVYNPNTEKLVSARAWIVTANGRRTTNFARSDFVDTVATYSSHFWNEHRVLRFDGSSRVEIGGAVAWEIELQSQAGIFDCGWAFASQIPVARSVFEVAPVAGGELMWFATSDRLRGPQAGASAGALRWELRGVEPLPEEKPDEFLPNPLRVSVRCVAPGAPADGLKSWADLARVAADIIEPRVEISADVRAKAEALVAGKAARWDRIRALAEFVQEEITYLSLTLDKDYLAGYRPHPAPEVLANRFGDCKDKATLLVAMLRAVGDNGHVVLVHATNPEAMFADWPSASFNHAIVGIPADAEVPASWPVVDVPGAGPHVMFDPTDSVTPLGVLPRVDQGGYGLFVMGTETTAVRMPMEAAEYNGLERHSTVSIDGNGGLKAEVEEVRIGSSGASHYARRSGLGRDRFGRGVEQRLSESVPLARQMKWTDEWERASSRHRVQYRFEAERFARQAGDLLLLNPPVLPRKSQLAPWNLEHEGNSWFPSERTRETIRLELPAGFAVEELPESYDEDNAFVSCRVRYRTDGNAIVFESEIVRPGGLYGPAEYRKLRAALQKIQAVERRPVILRRTAS